MKKLISIVISILLTLTLFCGCEENSVTEEKEVIDISSDTYYDLIDSVFENAIEANGYYEYGGYDKYYYPYTRVYIAPKDKYSDEVTKTQATELIKNVLDELKKYEYENGSFIKRANNYISVYFYGFTESGNFNRTAGPFLQISIFDIQKTTEEDLSF